MIFDTAPNKLQLIDMRLRTADMLQQTRLIHEQLTELGQPIEPISYFEIPPEAHEDQRLVLTYGHMLPTGFLDSSALAIYGVTQNPNAFTNESSEIRSREAHVYAEHLSLLRGIFTPFARANSEMRASRLIPAVYVGNYRLDRIVHLQAVGEKMENSTDLHKKQRSAAALEVANAIRALRAPTKHT